MRNIPFSPPDISEEEISAVAETLRSGWITTGPKTKQFEKEIIEYTGCSGTACLSSATAALECTLRILGIGKGDEVIVPAYTYTATASVVHHVGAKIVMCDLERDSFFMDYEKLNGLITEKTAPYILENGTDIPLKHHLFDNDAIILTDVLKSVYLMGKNTKRAIKVSYPQMENLGFWHMPKTDAPFVCVEPWMTLPANDGEPEVLETKKNIGIVESGKTFERDIIIEIIE